MLNRRRSAPVLLALLLVPLLAAGAPAAPVRAQTPPAAAVGAPVGAPFTAEPIPCPVAPAGGGETEGVTYDCGVVHVPEDYATPGSRLIELFYLRLRSPSAAPAPEPLVYLAGGPGGAASTEVSLSPVIKGNLDAIRRDRDVLVYDQRGTGYSGYLVCAPFPAMIGIGLERTDDPALRAAYDRLRASAVANVGLMNAICGAGYARLSAVDLAQYNSPVSVQDIAHLASTLGYARGYHLYGTSYGTRLAQYAMRQTPDLVKSVVLDGATGPSVPGVAWTIAKRAQQYASLFAQCRADRACAAAYPDLAARFTALLARLDAARSG